MGNQGIQKIGGQHAHHPPPSLETAPHHPPSERSAWLPLSPNMNQRLVFLASSWRGCVRDGPSLSCAGPRPPLGHHRLWESERAGFPCKASPGGGGAAVKRGRFLHSRPVTTHRGTRESLARFNRRADSRVWCSLFPLGGSPSPSRSSSTVVLKIEVKFASRKINHFKVYIQSSVSQDTHSGVQPQLLSSSRTFSRFPPPAPPPRRLLFASILDFSYKENRTLCNPSCLASFTDTTSPRHIHVVAGAKVGPAGLGSRCGPLCVPSGGAGGSSGGASSSPLPCAGARVPWPGALPSTFRGSPFRPLLLSLPLHSLADLLPPSYRDPCDHTSP